MKGIFKFEIWITLIYFILGVTWILVSDVLVKFFISDLNLLTQIQSFKGIIFVLLSSLVIYLIARHYRNQQQEIKKHLIEAKKKAEDSEQLKSAFLANLSHEIRTPMNGILGFVNLLEETDFQREKHQKYLEHLRISSERMLETLTDIIEISQIESNQSQLLVAEIDLKKLINSLHTQYLPVAESKGLKLELHDFLPVNGFYINTDESKLVAILKSFLKNAVKFSEEGTIEWGCKPENNRVVFFVKDNGIGIPPDLQEKIFERFIQGDSNMTRLYEGSGLGLPIARAYAQQLGGEIMLDSEEGKGSTFWLSLPQHTQNLHD